MSATMDDGAMAAAAEAQRQRGQAETQRIFQRLLDAPSGGTVFPDHVVILDGRELDWRTCDVALTFALQDRRGGTGMERWCRALPSASRYVGAQTAQFLKTGEPTPDPTPTRAARELARRVGLTNCPPLELETPKVRKPAGG